MDKAELAYWQSITQASTHQWVEDSITSRNDRGSLYYIGGEDGRYMRLSPEGKLTLGTYEGAYPHIGEALFKISAEHQYSNYNEAFQAACKIGGKQFLVDLFSASAHEEAPAYEIPFEMKM